MRALPIALAVLASCASVPEGPPPPSPERSFRGATGVALVHRLGSSGALPGQTRRRDPLDALQQSLADRGVKTVTVELPDRPPADLAALDALAREVEWSAASGPPPSGGPAVSSVGARAAPVLQGLGVDVLALFARAPGWGAPSSAPPVFGQPFGMARPPAPVSAIALIARDGAVVTFAWSAGGEPWGPGPLNAAEAIDAALGMLAGPPPE